jgi:uncharacterized membrane protein YfcA
MAEFVMTIPVFVILVLGGFCAGFVDSIAGGGGLIALPVLLSVGLPPHLALGTNKLQGTFGTLSASLNYIRNGKVHLREVATGLIFTFCGAGLGAWFIQLLEPGFIRHIIPIMLFAVFFYVLWAKDLGVKNRKAAMDRRIFFFIAGTVLGFYDGFFGPGTGSFWMAALILLLGYDMTQAAGTTRIMNFTSNIVALAVFVIGHKVVCSAGISMAIGQFIGARIGSGLAIRKGARFIRPIFLAVVFLTIARLGYLNYIK